MFAKKSRLNCRTKLRKLLGKGNPRRGELCLPSAGTGKPHQTTAKGDAAQLAYRHPNDGERETRHAILTLHNFCMLPFSLVLFLRTTSINYESSSTASSFVSRCKARFLLIAGITTFFRRSLRSSPRESRPEHTHQPPSSDVPSNASISVRSNVS